MTAQLNQIIAVEKGIKSRVYSSVGDLHKVLHKVLQKGELDGVSLMGCSLVEEQITSI